MALNHNPTEANKGATSSLTLGRPRAAEKQNMSVLIFDQDSKDIRRHILSVAVSAGVPASQLGSEDGSASGPDVLALDFAAKHIKTFLSHADSSVVYDAEQIGYLLIQFGRWETVARAASELAAASPKPALAESLLRLCASLTNDASTDQTRIDAVNRMLEVAFKTKQVAALRAQVDYIKAIVAAPAAGAVSASSRRLSFALLACILFKLQRHQDAYESVIRALLLSSKAAAAVPSFFPVAEQVSVAVQCFIRERSLVSADVLHQAILAVASQVDKPTLALAECFAMGTMASLEQWLAENAQFPLVAAVGGPETVLAKTRVLLLSSFAVEHTAEPVPYAVLAELLSVGEDQVEAEVLRSLSSGLVAGRMNQLSKVVAFSTSAPRSVGQSQWTQLEKKLVSMTDNLQKVVSAYDRAGER